MLPSFVVLLCFTFSFICIKVILSRKNVSCWYPFFANKSNWNVNWSIWNLLHTSKRYCRFTIQVKSRFKHNMSFSEKLVTGSTYILWQISGCGNSKTTKTRFYCMKYFAIFYIWVKWVVQRTKCKPFEIFNLLIHHISFNNRRHSSRNSWSYIDNIE